MKKHYSTRNLEIGNGGLTINSPSFTNKNPKNHQGGLGDGAALKTSGWITKGVFINFKDDFIGSNGSSATVVPGYPWSTLGSDAVSITSKNAVGGVWELKTGSVIKNQMNLFAGGTGKQISGTMTATLTLQVDQRVSTPNYYTGMKITKTGGNGAAGSHNIDSYNESTGVITSSTFTATKPGTTYTIGPEEITHGGGSFLLSHMKDLFFTARFRVTSNISNTHGFFIGLSSNTAKDIISDDCTSYKAITSNHDHTKKTSKYGFLISVVNSGGSGHGGSVTKTIKCVAHNNDDPSSGYTGDAFSTAITDYEKDTWYTCSMYVSYGKVDTLSSDFSINYVLTKTKADGTHDIFDLTKNVDTGRCSSTNQTPMAPAISIKNGATHANSPVYEIDYIEVHQKR